MHGPSSKPVKGAGGGPRRAARFIATTREIPLLTPVFLVD